MKKTRIFLIALLVIAFAINMAGCYMVSGQRMDKVKGTYKLTSYTYTPSYERKEGYTPKHYDYIHDEEYAYEDYLIVTGTATGYYVHKEANAPAYVKEVTLSYEYNAENTSKVEYVEYNDVITASSSDNEGNRLGVSGNVLNFSRPAFDYTQLFTNKAMRSEDLSVRWEKVDDATDLSYAKAQVGNLKEYDYNSFAVRGIYELWASTNIETGEVVESEYQYFFYVIDTAKGMTTATAYYALRETPAVQVKETVSMVNTTGDWSTITIDGVTWTDSTFIHYALYSYVPSTVDKYYESERDGIKTEIHCVSRYISDETVAWLIENRSVQE